GERLQRKDQQVVGAPGKQRAKVEWKICQPNCLRNRQALMPTSATANPTSASMCGQIASIPAPLSKTPRAIVEKWLIGLSSVNGCIHSGIASTGVVAPDSIESGGLTKKLINCACCCDLLNVARNVPMPIPASTQSIPAANSNTRLPRIGNPKTRRATMSASTIWVESSANSGAILAVTISTACAGVISNCSIVPASFSLTIDAPPMIEPLSTSRMPSTPVTMNHALSNPGLQSS